MIQMGIINYWYGDDNNVSVVLADESKLALLAKEPFTQGLWRITGYQAGCALCGRFACSH